MLNFFNSCNFNAISNDNIKFNVKFNHLLIYIILLILIRSKNNLTLCSKLINYFFYNKIIFFLNIIEKSK